GAIRPCASDLVDGSGRSLRADRGPSEYFLGDLELRPCPRLVLVPRPEVACPAPLGKDVLRIRPGHDPTLLDGLHQGPIVPFCLVGVRLREPGYRLVEDVLLPQVAADAGRVPRARVGAGESDTAQRRL